MPLVEDRQELATALALDLLRNQALASRVFPLHV